jgi:hypothetical protein
MSAQVTIVQLPAAGPITGTESVPIVQNGQTVQTTTGAIAASPSQNQTFLTINSEATLPNSRYLSTSTGLGLTDGGALSFYRIALNRAAGSLETALTGIVAKDTPSTVVARTLQASGSGLSVSDGNGVSGNPTFSLTGQVAALANASGAGLVALPNNGSVIIRTITGTASEIDVADGTGAAGNPTIGLADNPVLPGTEGAVMPTGNTAARPVSPTNGLFRYNSQTATFEGYVNNAWGAITVDAGVSSVDASGGTTGMAFTGGPITSVGTLTLTGTLGAANGGTGLTSYAVGDITYASGTTTISKLTLGAAGYFLTAGASAPQWSNPSLLTIGTATNIAGGAANRIAYNTSAGATSFIAAPTIANTYLEWSGSAFQWSANPIGSVTSVDVSGGTTGLTTSGGPITSSGTITLAGTLGIANGGSGQTTAQAALNAFAGAVTSGQYLRGNGTNVVMSAIQVADVPTLNQNTTGSAGSVANAVTFTTTGGDVAGTTFNGSAARTIDYSTVGAPKADGTGASGTWGISISGTAATATNLAGGAASQIPYQTGAGATAFIANGTAGQVLTSAGAGVPVWSGISGGTF